MASKLGMCQDIQNFNFLGMGDGALLTSVDAHIIGWVLMVYNDIFIKILLTVRLLMKYLMVISILG